MTDNPEGLERFLKTPLFWTYLTCQYGTMCTSSRSAATVLCRILEVDDIYKISESRISRVAWEAMMSDFHHWLKKINLR